MEFTGERLVPDSKILLPLRIENLARFHFFREQIQGIQILDLGCGAGEGTGYLADSPFTQIFGVDISFRALITARQEYGKRVTGFVQMDIEHLALPDQLFDAIISVEVIEHVSDPVAYLGEAYRVVKSSGEFMLTTPNKLRSSPNPGSLWPAHRREYTPDQLAELLHKFYDSVELWGEYVPIYEGHPVRKLFRKLAPVIKPYLPHWIRIRALPILQTAIKPNLQIEDVVFTQENIEDLPTLVAICRK